MTDYAALMRPLIDRLNEASRAYYTLGESMLSDMQWDQLYDQLAALEKESGLVLEDSPTHRVGSEPLKGFEEHTHLSRLWSMDKVQSISALEDWIHRTEKLAGQTELQYYVEYKFDGLTLNLTYRDGRLVQAATRGNGIYGKAVLPQAKTVRAVPLTIPYRGV